MDQLRTWILHLQQFIDTLPGPLQVSSIFLIGMVPFLEGDVAATIGVVVGIHWLPSILLGVLGTVTVTFLTLTATARLGQQVQARRSGRTVIHRVERWGVPVAMLISGFFVSVPMTVFIMHTAGLSRSIVLASAIAVAILNGFVAGLLAAGMMYWVIDI
jgi:hypothetical protein